jgi:hypothetical protein
MTHYMKRFSLLLAVAFFLFAAPHAFADTAQQFVPLTSLPGVSGLAQNTGFAPFFNSLYKICIGVAATIAVLQIMRAGIMYMGGDSVTETKQARELIQNAVLGLVLVLSPYIIFSIINPKILDLNVGFGDLTPNTAATSPANQPQQNDLGQDSNAKNDVGGATVAPKPTAPNCPYIIPNSTIIDDNNNQQVSCCSSQSNGYADCMVQRRSPIKGIDSVAYCGCSIKPNIGMEYDVYYVAPKGTSDRTNYVLVGIAPKSKVLHDTTVKGCTAAGGKVTDKTSAGLVDKLLNQKFSPCKADDQIPADPAKSFLCVPMALTCTNQ